MLFFIWPVGMPLMLLLILLPMQRDIRKGHNTSSTRATAFLHKVIARMRIDPVVLGYTDVAY